MSIFKVNYSVIEDFISGVNKCLLEEQITANTVINQSTAKVQIYSDNVDCLFFEGTLNPTQQNALDQIIAFHNSLDECALETDEFIEGNANITGYLVVGGNINGRDVAEDGATLDDHISNVNIHIDHSNIEIISGEGISGGGNLVATRTIELDINSLTTEPTPEENSDFVAIFDTSAGNHKKVLLENLPGEDNTATNVGTGGIGIFKQKSGVNLEFKNLNAASSKISIVDDFIDDEVDIDVNENNIDHDVLLNFVENKHVDHSNLLVIAGEGLSGGGNLIASRTLDLDINGLGEDVTPNIIEDFVVTFDTSAGEHKKVLLDNLKFLPATYLNAYDSTGGQTFTTTPITINFDTERQNSGDFIISSGVITANVDTLLIFNFFVTCDDSATVNRSDWTAFLERDTTGTGSSYAEVPGSRTFTYSRNASQGIGTGGSATCMLDVNIGELFRVRAVRNSGPTTFITIANGSGITIFNPGTKGDAGTGGGGEENTASNVGVGGVGLFKQKTGVNLEFKNVNAGSSKITIVDDVANDEVDFDLDESTVNHDALLNFVANEHIDHSSVSIIAGEGLSGGGDLLASRTLDIDINSLTTETTPDGSADFIAIYDSSAGDHKKVLLSNIPISNSFLSRTTSTSTTGAAFSIIPTLTFTTPASGTYFVSFSGAGECNTDNTQGLTAIFVDGVEQTASTSQIGTDITGFASLGFIRGSLVSQTIASVNGSQNIDVRFRVTGGTLTVFTCTFTIIKVA